MTTRAFIFDVDGTFIDTNAAHVEAWRAAFEAHGFPVTEERITVEIGKGGDKLVPAIVGDEREERHGDTLREAHDEAFVRLARSGPFRVFPGVRELLAVLIARRVPTAVATSSKDEHLDATLASAGLDLRALVDEVVTASDAKSSKPAPDIIVAALNKLGRNPEECWMVGDTPHDGTACRGAGVAFVAVRCGGNPDSVLREAGARTIVDDPAELLIKLDDFLPR